MCGCIYIYRYIYRGNSAHKLHKRLRKPNYVCVCICVGERSTFMFARIRKNSYLNSPKLSYIYSFSHLQQLFLFFLFFRSNILSLQSYTHTRTQSFRINVLFDLNALYAECLLCARRMPVLPFNVGFCCFCCSSSCHGAVEFCLKVDKIAFRHPWKITHFITVDEYENLQ